VGISVPGEGYDHTWYCEQLFKTSPWGGREALALWQWQGWDSSDLVLLELFVPGNGYVNQCRFGGLGYWNTGGRARPTHYGILVLVAAAAARSEDAASPKHCPLPEKIPLPPWLDSNCHCHQPQPPHHTALCCSVVHGFPDLPGLHSGT
jgi:hypothetical protein